MAPLSGFINSTTVAKRYGSALASTREYGAREQVTMEAESHEALSISQTAADRLTQLIDGMRRGDERALEELYDATVGKLYALATAILRHNEDAEEVVCATYAYAWANVARYDVSRANPLGWLLMLCRSRALDRLRQRRATPVSVDIDEIMEVAADSDPQPDDLLTLLQQRGSVHAALTQLTPERRNLISLAFLQDMSHQEIATATGIPLGTVKSHLRRALVQLRAALEAV